MYGSSSRGNAMSGANNVPIGFKSGGFNPPSLGQNPSNSQGASYGSMWSSGPSSEAGGSKRSADLSDLNGSQSGERKKKKRSRWGDEEQKVNIAMPTVLPPDLSKEQEEAYLLQLQIEELTRRLRTGDLGIPANPEERSPSPEPIYNHEGKRMNTREYRTRKKIEEDRHKHITRMFELNKDYKPPVDYKPPIIKISDKVMIPQDEHPGINFVGLLIGPRGNTLKAMEKETGAKIIIRGKGSVKEGKVGRKDGQPLPGEDEPLHAYVTSNSAESVKKAVERIKDVIKQGIEVPEGQNDLRRMQLRELALLNGTLRELDGPRCNNCGASTHKSWECPDKPNVTHTIICSACGGSGHIARDCRQRSLGMGPPGDSDSSKIDEEYSALMAELGEAPPKGSSSSGGGRYGQQGNYGYRGQNVNGSGGYRQRMNMSGQGPPQPPPPGSSSQSSRPPWGMPPPGVAPPMGGFGGGHSQWGGPPVQSYGGSQYSWATPPPPPPPSSSSADNPSQSSSSNSQAPMGGMSGQGSWGMQGGWGMPPPVPPPAWGGMQSAQSQQGYMTGYMGVPPPPPPTTGAMPPASGSTKSSMGSKIDLNALAQAGLPNLLAAPPPPPPPPQ